MNTAPDQNSLEQLGYSPPLQHARDTVPIHKRRHRATLSRRHHRLLQQPAHKRLLLCHHAACPLHDTGTMPIELIPRGTSRYSCARRSSNIYYDPTPALKLSLRQVKGPYLYARSHQECYELGYETAAPSPIMRSERKESGRA